MVEAKKRFRIIDWDKKGPHEDNFYTPSIVVQRGKKDRLCVGLKYNGQSSLDATSYELDHANRHRGRHQSWPMSRDTLEKELEGSNYDIEKLKREYVKRIRRKP